MAITEHAHTTRQFKEKKRQRDCFSKLQLQGLKFASDRTSQDRPNSPRVRHGQAFVVSPVQSKDKRQCQGLSCFCVSKHTPSPPDHNTDKYNAEFVCVCVYHRYLLNISMVNIVPLSGRGPSQLQAMGFLSRSEKLYLLLT